jgi:hypothetical protein
MVQNDLMELLKLGDALVRDSLSEMVKAVASYGMIKCLCGRCRVDGEKLFQPKLDTVTSIVSEWVDLSAQIYCYLVVV